MTARKPKRTPARKRATIAPAVAHGVELPTLPPGSMAADVAALIQGYFDTQDVPLAARRLMTRAALLRADWQAGECRCIERHPPDRRAGSAERIAAEVQAMMDAYFGNATVHPEARRLIGLATRLRQAWQAAGIRCIERHPPERRAGSAERLASFAYQRAMARLIEAARELAALPVRH